MFSQEIEWLSSDKSLHYKMQIIMKKQLKYYYVGKTYPVHTQCVLWCNGLLQDFATVIKHDKDEHDPKFAIKLCGEKVLKSINNKWARSQVRIELNTFIDTL